MEITSLLGNPTNRVENPVLSNFQNEQLESSNQNSLGKDDFLRLLVTQLKYQDPTEPLEDKEFISQMAQFTSLEQMTNIAKGFQDVSTSVNKNYALSLLGKEIEITSGEDTITGIVDTVTTGSTPQVGINGTLYKVNNITRVSDVQEVQ